MDPAHSVLLAPCMSSSFPWKGEDKFLGGGVNPFPQQARVLLHLLQLQVQSNEVDI